MNKITPRHITNIIAASLLIILIAASCSKKKYFTISGQIEGLGAQTISITYFADGGIKRQSHPAVDGKFALRGQSSVATLCIVESYDGSELATLVVSDGDEITIKGQLGNPASFQVKGNAPSSKIAQWSADNAALLSSRNAAKINEAVAEFIRNNRKDVAAAALLVTKFYTPGFEQLADSLLTGIDPAVRRPEILQGYNSLLAAQLTKHQAGEINAFNICLRNDSTVQFNPATQSYSILAFRPATSSANDSVVKTLRRLVKDHPKRRLKILEISMARDSALWKQSTARDSATWLQAWAPGSVASREFHKLAIPVLPFFILTDSTGMQVYRGSSVSMLKRQVDAHIKQ